MKIKTMGQLTKDGFFSVWRNRMMTVASLFIVIATLLIFGMFISITENVNYFAKGLESKFQIMVFLKKSISEKQSLEICKKVKNINGVKNIKYNSKEDAVKYAIKITSTQWKWGDKDEVAKEMMKDKPLKRSIVVDMSNARLSNDVAGTIEKIDGVDNVKYSKNGIQTLVKINGVIKSVSLAIIIVLSIISIFIIANTVKITVFARKREIGIMRLIGATDTFIRWPFIVEGLSIGLVGSIIAFIFMKFAYDYSYDALYNKLIIFKTIMNFKSISYMIISSFMGIGVLIGGLGSFVSVRRYLK